MQKTNKFKLHMKNKTLTSKITLLYTFLFSVVLILVSCFVLGNTWAYYRNLSKAEIIDAANKVESYLSSGGDITKDNLKKIVDNNYIDVMVSYEDPKDNREFTMTKPDMIPYDNNANDEFVPKLRKSKDFDIKQISQAEYMFAHRRVVYNNKTYNIDVFRNFSHAQKIMKIFFLIFLICNAIAILVSYIIGKYISKKMLKPIRDVIEAADNISINDLEQRIEVPETDDEIRKLIVTFNDMISRLDDSFKKHKQFISDASHELKTPIAVIQGYVNLIDRWGKSDEAVLDESIESIKSETEHMNNLIQQLLFLARSDNNKNTMKMENISLKNIAIDTLKDISVLNENIDTELISDNDDINIYGDAILIKQLMGIFCENAMKYHSDNPLKISIKVGYVNDKPYFSVADNGIGIDEESLPHIFDRFYRADKSRNKTIEGNGLGLSIANWIIKSHNATINVKSKVGVGSEFIVIFN